MKKERLTKRLALFTALTLTGAMLAGCGNTDAAESSSDAQTGVTADTQASAGDASADVVYRTLDEIKESGTINIGVFSDKNPFGYVDENGEYQGYDVYFANRLAEDLGVDVNFVSTEAASRIEYLQTGKVDIILANFTVTPERAEEVDFALPYMNVSLGVISPDSAVVESLDETVELYLIAPQGKEDEKLTRLLEKYEELGDKIKVTYVDSILSPTFVQSYTSDKVSDNSIIAVGPERSKVIRNSDLFPSNYDYNTGKTTTDFDGEGQITSAIHFVTGENLSHMYMITGHGETELPEQFTALLEKEGVEYDKLNLMTINEVPQNAECLLEYIPVSDITKTEAEVLTKYLENGGKLLLITGISAAEMPNLGEVMSGYGLASIQGLIMEGDGNHCIPSYQNFLLPEIKDSAVTSSFISKDELLLLPNSHAITVLPDVRSTVDVQEILMTSKSSWLKTDTSDLSYKKGDLTGPFAVGVLASEPVGDDQTRIAWFSSDSLMVDEIDEMVSGNNKNLILNTIGWMTEQDNNIAIRAKNTQAVTLRLTSAQVMQWSIVYLAVIPGIVLAAGIIFCVRRRRRQ